MYISAVYQGDIQKRLERSYERLTSERYHLHKTVRNEGNGGWPGDYEGRTFLALVQLWDATGKKPEYFEEIASLLVEWVGEKGYFGQTPKAGESDEQQLSRQQLVLPFYVRMVSKNSGFPSPESVGKRCPEPVASFGCPI